MFNIDFKDIPTIRKVRSLVFSTALACFLAQSIVVLTSGIDDAKRSKTPNNTLEKIAENAKDMHTNNILGIFGDIAMLACVATGVGLNLYKNKLSKQRPN